MSKITIIFLKTSWFCSSINKISWLVDQQFTHFMAYSYASVEVQSGSQFATYVTPTVPISQEALQVTGISMTDGTMTFIG